MMNVTLAESERLSLHDYEQLVYHWNQAHAPNEEADELDKADVTMRAIERAKLDPRLVN